MSQIQFVAPPTNAEMTKVVTAEYYHFPRDTYTASFLNELPRFSHYAADMMRMDDQVTFATACRNGPLMNAEVVLVPGTHPEQEEWILDTWKKIWATSSEVLLEHKVYGHLGTEFVYKKIDGEYEFKYVKPIHPSDTQVLLHKDTGDPCGIKVQPSSRWSRYLPKVIGGMETEPAKEGYMLNPKGVWLTHKREFGSPYGVSAYLSAWPNFWEKWMKGGARKQRQLYYMKYSLWGVVSRYPNEMIKRADGSSVHGSILMREAVDSLMSGFGMNLPSDSFDASNGGKYKFDISPPFSLQAGPDIEQWVDGCDARIFDGIGTPKEIIKAATSGSGYSGRSIPMMMFCFILQMEFAAILSQIKEQHLFPMAHRRFGYAPDCDLVMKPLLETLKLDANPSVGDQDGGQAVGSEPTTIAPRPALSRFSEDDGDSSGYWITIGAKDGHGGTPVKILNGKIVSGPASLAGKKLADVAGAEKGRHEYRQAIREGAKEHGVAKSQLHEAVQDLWQDRRSAIMERESAKAAARKATGLDAGQISRMENSGKDYTSLKHFDASAEEIAGAYPELGIGGGREQGANADTTDYAAKLWDVLREGRQEAPVQHDPDLVREAAQNLKRLKKENRRPITREELDAIPFSEEPANQEAEPTASRALIVSRSLVDDIRQRIESLSKKNG